MGGAGMNRSNYFNYIEEKINILSYRIKSRGKINLLDLNIYSETFFAELMNHLLGYELKNINVIKQNTEGIDLVNDEIDALNEKKASFNLNETLEEDLEQLNIVKYNINRTSALISKLEIRKNLIEESQRDLERSISHIDLQQLRLLYEEVTENISGIQKTFEDLVAFHNNMVIEKVKYISQDLPELIQK